MSTILGISAFYHDSAAALIKNNVVIAAAQEERFNRKKHTANFPIQSIKFCLEEGGISIDELDAIVFYDKPLLKFERLLETYFAIAPKGIISFLKAIPIWLNEKLFIKNQIYSGLKQIEQFDKKRINLLFSEHHLSHAASAFFCSTYEEAAILTVDGVGEYSTATISYGNGKSIKTIKELHFPHSVGLLYSAFTYFLGFRVNSGEYKVMGLAPYGDRESLQVQKYRALIKSHLVKIYQDGSIWLNQDHFNYMGGLTMIKEKNWEKLFGLKRRAMENELSQQHCDLALAIQTVIEEIVVKMAIAARNLTQSDNLCLAGGVALNCVANYKIFKQSGFKNIFVQPASGDAGGSLGAALAVNHIKFDQPRIYNAKPFNVYLGSSFSSREVNLINRKMNANSSFFEKEESLCNETARLIEEGKVVGWFQGNAEFGPRALGNRSILANPKDENMQQKVNLKIKKRESFRPFAPSVLMEDVENYFEERLASPYMLLVNYLKAPLRCSFPENYEELSLLEKIRIRKGVFSAITHLDYSSRVQTVKKENNQLFHLLLTKMKEISGHGLLLNTSFNVRGEPIVNSPQDAYECFMNTEMDILVIGNYLYVKEEQPFFGEKEIWNKKFRKD